MRARVVARINPEIQRERNVKEKSASNSGEKQDAGVRY
jgi:hypothetical protein